MTFATKAMDKRWFLDRDDPKLKKWFIEQNNKFAQRIKDVYFPDVVKAERERDILHIADTPKEYKRKLFLKPIMPEKSERQIMQESRLKTATEYAQKFPFGRGNKIVEETAEKYGVTVRLLKSVSRSEPLVRARREATFRLREELGYSFPKIGDLLGGRDHSTCHYNYYKFLKAAENDHANSV